MCSSKAINPQIAKHDYSRFKSVLLAGKLQLLWMKCMFQQQYLQMFGHKLLQIQVISTHLKLWIAEAKHNFMWVNIYFSKVMFQGLMCNRR